MATLRTTRLSLPILFALVTTAGCALDTASSSAPLCGTEARDLGDDVSVSIGCSWDQQYYNVMSYGEPLETPERVVADGVEPGVTVTRRCADWALGTDPTGVQVLVNTADGTVRWHGQVHEGQAVSALPAELPLPISLQP